MSQSGNILHFMTVNGRSKMSNYVMHKIEGKKHDGQNEQLVTWSHLLPVSDVRHVILLSQAQYTVFYFDKKWPLSPN